MRDLCFTKRRCEHSFRHGIRGNEYVPLYRSALSPTIKTVEALYIFTWGPRGLCNETMARNILKAISTSAHRKDISQSNLDARVGSELIDEPLFLKGSGRSVDPDKSVPAKLLLQDVKDLDMPREDYQLLFAAVNEHVNIVGDLRREGYAHHSSDDSDMSEHFNIGSFEVFWVDVEQTFSSQSLLNSTRLFHLDEIVHWQLKLWHNLSLKMTYHKVRA